MAVHYDLLCFALYLLALMAVAMGEPQLRVNEEPASSFLPPLVATVQAPFTNTTVAGCIWAGLICVDIGHACDEPKENKIAYDMARAHCPKKKDEDEQQQMQQQFVLFPEIAVKQQREEEQQTQELSPQSGVDTTAVAALVQTPFTNTTVAGCVWAGLICVEIGHACDEPKANKIAYNMARPHCHKNEDDPVFV